MTDLTRLGGGEDVCGKSTLVWQLWWAQENVTPEKKTFFSGGKNQSPNTHKGTQTCTFEDHQNLREQERGQSGGPAEEMNNNSKNLKKIN